MAGHRLSDIAPDGLSLNGTVTDPAADLRALLPDPQAAVILRPVEGDDPQRLVGAWMPCVLPTSKLLVLIA